MTILTTKAFRSGNSEAVRLPKGFAYGTDVELEIERIGEVTTIRPKRPSVAEMVARLRSLPNPSEVESRVPIEFPERPGL